MKSEIKIFTKTNFMKIFLPDSKSSFYLFIIGIIIITGFIEAQEIDRKILTLERIYKEREFRQKSFGPARWFEDGSGYSTLEKSEEFENAKDIIKYNPETGERSILVSAGRLIPEGQNTPLLISDYKWSARRE